jgi:phage repressor protein C with HTH and peptisase S24 domain
MRINSDAFSERLGLAIGARSVREIARACGMAEGSIRQYLSGKSDPSRSALISLSNELEVSLTWLATGEGPRNRGAKEGHGETREADPLYRGERDLVAEGGYVMVPRYDVTASAGPGALVTSEQVVDYLAFKVEWIKRMALEASQLALITVMGDSMYPTIRDGFLLLVDLRQREVKMDAIYILRFDSELVAKRLQRLFDGGIRIKSDNSAYDEQVVPADQVQRLNIVGKVVWGGGKM